MSNNLYSKGHAAGASASIEKTINELEEILDGKPLEYSGKLREELRGEIEESLLYLAKKWYKKGFNRGHKESYRGYVEEEEFPQAISTIVKRSLLPKSKKRIRLKSRLSDDFIEEVDDGLW